MLHRYAFALLLLSGCFRDHGLTDDEASDGGVGRDGGAWTTCREADEGGGRTGDPCSFEGSCFGSGPCGGTTTTCDAGTLRIEHMHGDCPTSCEDLEALGGDPSGQPCEADFGTCTVAVSECCIGSFRCETGSVVQVGATACDTECGTGEVCESWAPPPPETVPCTSDGDCDPDGVAYCLPPGEDRGCGICSRDESSCVSDADCPEDTHCEEYDPGCPPCDGIAPETCVADCTPGGCPDGQECTDGGACVPLRCDTGAIDCPENFRCTGFSGDGCLRLACESDGDCDCGSCIGGRCYEGPGTCELPRA